jgi:hypothetical protein
MTPCLSKHVGKVNQQVQLSLQNGALKSWQDKIADMNAMHSVEACFRVFTCFGFTESK